MLLDPVSKMKERKLDLNERTYFSYLKFMFSKKATKFVVGSGKQGEREELRFKNERTYFSYLKFMFSKNATKIYEILTIDLTLCSKCQLYGEDFVNFCDLLRKHELYEYKTLINKIVSRFL